MPVRSLTICGSLSARSSNAFSTSLNKALRPLAKIAPNSYSSPRSALVCMVRIFISRSPVRPLHRSCYLRQRGAPFWRESNALYGVCEDLGLSRLGHFDAVSIRGSTHIPRDSRLDQRLLIPVLKRCLFKVGGIHSISLQTCPSRDSTSTR